MIDRAPRTREAGVEPALALAHPVWIASLAVLVLNDHFLKGAGLLPGWVTGKLSDVAGLIVAPVLFAAIVRARRPITIAIAHLMVAVGFAAMELSSSLTELANAAYHVAGLSWVNTRDVTDLFAIAVVPLAYRLTLAAGAKSTARARVHAATVLGAAGIVACAASSNQSERVVCTGEDCDGDGTPSPLDCNDYDASLRLQEGCPVIDYEHQCSDGIDDDGDGKVDCKDEDCAAACFEIVGACTSGDSIAFDTIPGLVGSTTAGTDAASGSCAGADQPEVVFHGTTPGGTLRLGVPAGHAIHVRRDCVDPASEIACDAGPPNGTNAIEVEVGGEVSVIVERVDPTASDVFYVPVDFIPLYCGDGDRLGLEECDDGNNLDGDGCTSDCHVEWDLLCGAIPTLPLGTIDDSFAAGTRAVVSPCGGSPDTLERGYDFVATGSSMMFAVTSTADVTLYAITNCGEDPSYIGCSASVSAVGQLTIDTVPDELVTLFVELPPGAPEDTTFTLTASVP